MKDQFRTVIRQLKRSLEQFLQLSTTYKVIGVNTLVLLGWAALAFYDIDSFLKPWPRTMKALAMLIGAVGGSISINFYFTRKVLHPVEELSKLINEIANGQLDLRAKRYPWGGKVINQCVDSLNQMLDVLEKERQRSRWLAEQLIQAQEEERRRIARELHDESNQILATLGIRLEQLKSKIPPFERLRECHEEIDALQVLSQSTLVELRRMAFNLRPTLLDNLGLKPALSWLFREQLEESGIQLKWNWEGAETRLKNSIELAVFRICQEATTNVIKHAKATRVDIDVLRYSDKLILNIRDNGIGFDSDATDSQDLHTGIFAMRERILFLSGSFDIQSEQNFGTIIHVIIPLTPFVPKNNEPLQKPNILEAVI